MAGPGDARCAVPQPALVRPPAVAGAFYPQHPQALRAALHGAWADRRPLQSAVPKALIVPHAGYRYSGAVAASAYALLQGDQRSIERVVLLGPSHHYALSGFCVPQADAWQTPLGTVALDTALLAELATRPDVLASDRVHQPEHALEVQLPFLQQALAGPWRLVPVLVGQADAAEVAGLIDALWGGAETLVVVSTDLSHFLPLRQAEHVDAATVAQIAALRSDGLSGEQACGARPLAGLLQAARRRGMRAQVLDVRTSADAGGDAQRVVGYASVALF